MKKLFESRRMTMLLIALVGIFSIHLIASNADSLRADLTADDLYSLSDGTRAILDKMKNEGVKPIDLKLFFSETAGKSLPKFIKDFITYDRYLRTLLRQYEVASDGKVKVAFHDPIPDTDLAQDAQDFGLEGKPINQHGDLFFFGLVLQTQTGSKDVIDFLWPSEQETIEYEITKRIHSLIWPNRKRVGVLSSLEVLSDASNPYMAQILAAQGKRAPETWLSMKLLEESYNVSKIGVEVTEISREDYDLVVVVHPKNLSEDTLWALDDWIVRGGNALIFLDPYAIDDQPMQNPQQPWMAYQHKPSSNLERLLAKWGVERREDHVAADFDLAVKRMVSRRGPAERMIVDLLIDGQLAAETLDQDHPITRGLTDLRFFMAGSLKPTEDPPESVTLTPLITTTKAGGTLMMQPGFPSGDQLVFNDVNDPAKLRDKFAPTDEPVVLAYMVQGKLETAFPEGVDVAATPGPDGESTPEMIHIDPVPEEDRGEATVLLFADVDLISDQIAFQNSLFGTTAANDNYKVLLNAVDYLLGSEELMLVRSKNTIDRPFTLFDEIERQAEQQSLERERALRADIDRFQQELQEKQNSMGARNAALFEKQLRDEVDALNEKIQEANRELREIRKEKRAALEAEEGRVRFATLWTTPSLVLVMGLVLLFRRQRSDRIARGSAS